MVRNKERRKASVLTANLTLSTGLDLGADLGTHVVFSQLTRKEVSDTCLCTAEWLIGYSERNT